MIRDEKVCASLPDPVRKAVVLSIGREARFFVGEDVADSVLAYNREPEGMPGLWCQWVPTADGTALRWDQNEKFYYYKEWLIFLITHFLEPWGCKLNGTVRYQGVSLDDYGALVVRDSLVTVMDSREQLREIKRLWEEVLTREGLLIKPPVVVCTEWTIPENKKE